MASSTLPGAGRPGLRAGGESIADRGTGAPW